MDYGNTLSRAWKIVWANKWLFVLGFLAALGSGGSGGSGNFNFNSGPSGNSEIDSFGQIADTLSEFAPIIIAAVCFFFFLAIILWLLRLIGEAGMIVSVDRIEAGETMGLRDGFRAGKDQLVNMIKLSLILYGPFLVIGLIMAGIGITLAFSSASGGDDVLTGMLGLVFACFIPVICILIIAGLVVNFVYPMAQRSIILHGLGTREGIRHGWNVLRSNFGEVFILALIFVLIGFAIGIATLIIVIPLAIVFFVPLIVALVQGSAALTAATIIFAVLGGIVFILLSAAISSILRTFQSTTFTLAYHQWAGKKTT